MATNKWSLDQAHSVLSFKVKHLMISTVTGTFDKFNVEVETTTDDFSDAKISFSAETSSINTNNEQRDNHLRSPEFFDSGKYPTMKFTSEAINKTTEGNIYITGNLTVKDITKQVRFEAMPGGIAKDPYGNIKAGFEVDFKINREDFGLTWNAALETGGVMVSSEVRIIAEIQLIKQA
jgi:polyisoprenoid-binding protein YceI